jgi:hypothetical protein
MAREGQEWGAAFVVTWNFRGPNSTLEDSYEELACSVEELEP